MILFKADRLVEIQSTNHERIRALLSAIIFVLGIIVAMGSLVWLLTSFENGRAVEPRALGQLKFNPEPHESTDLVRVSHSLETPGVEDFPETDRPEIEASLDLINRLPSRLPEALNGLGLRTSRGLREARLPGPVPTIADRNIQRWTVEYSATDLADYARQLEHFGIEIGVISHATNRIDLISNLPYLPTRRVSSRLDERRMYLTHRDRRFAGWDKQLANAAGVDGFSDRTVAQFYPARLRVHLSNLEIAYAGSNDRDLKQVARTLFRIRQGKKGFEFYVVEMEPGL